MPHTPEPLPQQQVIQVSMVAPSITAQKQKPVVEAVKTPAPSLVPPKETGMLKKQPPQKTPPQKQVKKQVEKTPETPQVAQQSLPSQMTTGKVSEDATQKHSAITKPAPADYLKNPPPHYPENARRKKQQGTVLLNVLVAASGLPKSVAIDKSSGIGALDSAALEAVRQWKFIPARRGSEIVEARVQVPIKFKLN